jgi:hypothetical protein
MNQMATHDQSRDSKKSWLVLISHAGTDTWLAKRISEQIEARGAKTFLDEAHIAVGEDFEERILNALDRANELLVILTPWSLKRPFVWSEVGAAWLKRIPIIAVLYGLTPEKVHAQPSIPVFFKRREFIDINQFDKYLSELQERVIKDKEAI